MFMLSTFDCVQAIFCCVPTCHDSPPLGEASQIEEAGSEIVNTPLLTSNKLEFDASLIFTRACVVGVDGKGHECVPGLAGLLAMMRFHVEPLLVEYSILTFATPEADHVMVWLVPTVQFSPPLGAVTTMAEPLAKGALNMLRPCVETTR
jgi:hypothetical protein